MKLSVSDGAILGTFDTGTGPIGITFDGKYLWVINCLSSTVTKMKGDYPDFILKGNE